MTDARRPMPSVWSPRILSWFIGGLILAVFAADLVTPLGYAVPLLFGIPLLLSLWYPSKSAPLVVFGITTLLTLIEFLWSPPATEIRYAIVNRAMIVGAGACLTWLLLRMKDHQRALGLAQHAVAHASDAVLFADETKRFVYVNDAACRSLGYPREELLSLRIPDIAPRHDPRAFAERTERLRQGAEARYESVHRRKDGTEFPIEISVSCREYQGQPVTCAIARDITERKRVEEGWNTVARGLSMTRGAGFFRLLVEHLADTLGADYAFVAEVTKEKPHRAKTIAFWARGMIVDNIEYDMRGTPCEDVFGKGLSTYPRRVQQQFPQDVWLAQARVEAYIGAPLFDSTENPLGLMGVLYCRPLDSTAMAESILQIFATRAAAEIERTQTEARLRLRESAMDHSSEGMFIVAADGRILAANETVCRRLEYTCEELLTMTIADIDPDYPARRWPSHWHELKQAGRLVIETVNRTKSGRMFPVEVSIAYLPWAAQECCCSIITDITERKKAEAALQASEARYHTLYDETPAMYFTVDAAGVVRSANAFGAAQLGYAPDELIGRPVTDLFHHEDKPEAAQALAAAFEDVGLVSHWEFRKVHRDGSILWVRETVHIVRHQSEPMALIVCEDITERKRAERALQRARAELEAKVIERTAALSASEERLRRVTDTIPGAVYQYQLTPDGTQRFLFMSKGCHDLFGCPAAKALEDFSLVWNLVLPEDVGPLWSTIRHSAATLSPWRHEFRIRLADGAIKWLRGSSIPEPTRPDGSIVWNGILIDITERTRAEEALRVSEARFREVTEHIQEVFWLGDTAKREVLYVSPAYESVWGRSCEGLYASPRSWLEAIHPDDRERVWQAACTKQTAGTYDEEYRIVRPDGAVRWIRDRAFPIRDEQGGVIRIAGIAGDITARKEAEQALAHLNSTLEQQVAERTAALRESEERWKFALEGADEGVWDWNAQTNEVYYSPRWKSMLGFEEQEIGATLAEWDSRVHPEDRDVVGEKIDRHLSGMAPVYTSEHRVRCKDGSYKWILDRGKVMSRTADGKALRVVGTHRDISERKQAELALRKSEARFRAAFQNAAVGIVLCSPEGVLQSVNARFCEILGRPESEIVGRSFAEFTHPDDLPRNMEWLRRLVSLEMREANFEKRYLTKTDAIIWVALSVSYLHEAGEAPGYFLTIVQDVTARKQAEEDVQRSHEQLQRSEALVRAVVDNLPLMVFIKEARELRFVRFNKAAEEIVGLSESEVLGKSDYHFFPKEQADFFVAKDRAVFERGQVLDIPEEPIQTKGQGLRYLHTKKFPIFDPEGRPRFLVGISEDITERKAIEAALRASEERYRAVVESQSELVCRFRADTTLTFVNEAYARYFGHRAEDLIGRRVLDLLPEEDRAAVRAHVSDLAEFRNPIAYEQRIVLPSGDVRWQEWINRAICDAEGRVQEYQSVGRDVTDRRRAEESLRQSEERFRLLFEQSNTPMALLDHGKRYLRVNRAMCDLVGYDESELIGRTYALCTHPDDLDANLRLTDEFLSGARSGYTVEKRYIRKDGRTLWVSVTVSGVVFPDSPQPRILALVQDVTARKQAEAAQRESEERFRSAFEMAPIGMALATSDGHILRVNYRLCALLGYSEEELIGVQFSTLSHPDDLSRTNTGIAALESGRLSVYIDENRYLHKDGRAVPAVLTLSWLRGEAGKPIYRLAQIQDLTELRRTEADLRRAQALANERARFQALVSALPDLTFVVDAAGRFQEIFAADNEAPHFASREAVLGRTFHEVLPPELAERFLAFVRHSIETGESQSITYELEMPDGVRWYEARSSAPIREGLPTPRVVCVVREVTERVRRQALEERERIGRDLHDGILQSLYATGLALESSQELLNDRPREGRQLLDQVVAQLNDVMQEVRQFIGGLDTGVSRGDEWEAAVRVLVQSHSTFYHVQSEMRIDPEAVLALSVGERLTLLNILREALSNSLRHGRPRSILVELQREQGTIRLRVKDDGRGFHPTAVAGSGYGLRNMKTRANSLGARFQIVSDLGTGTEVVVELTKQEVDSHVRVNGAADPGVAGR